MTNASDQFANPTEEILHYQNKYGATYLGPLEDGAIGQFQIDRTVTDDTITKIEGGETVNQMYTGSLEGTALMPGPDSTTDSPRISTPSKSDMRNSGLLYTVNENIVDVHTVTFDTYQASRVTTGNMVTFNIDFKTGQKINGSVQSQSVNFSQDLGAFRRVKSVSTNSMVLRSNISRGMRRVNIKDIEALRGEMKLQ